MNGHGLHHVEVGAFRHDVRIFECVFATDSQAIQMPNQFFERGVGGIEVFDGVIAHLANLVQALELVRRIERHKIGGVAINALLQFGPAALFS